VICCCLARDGVESWIGGASEFPHESTGYSLARLFDLAASVVELVGQTEERLVEFLDCVFGLAASLAKLSSWIRLTGFWDL
jgi:hypothetical protein